MAASLWLLVAISMRTPKMLSSKIVSLKNMEYDAIEAFLEQVSSIEGVQEVSVYREDQVAYLKVEKYFDERPLNALLAK